MLVNFGIMSIKRAIIKQQVGDQHRWLLFMVHGMCVMGLCGKFISKVFAIAKLTLNIMWCFRKRRIIAC